jgi:hypothetical protein
VVALLRYVADKNGSEQILERDVMTEEGKWIGFSYCFADAAQQQVLGFKPPPRLEQVDDENPQGLQDCVRRLSSWADSLSTCESAPDAIFGKDKQENPHAKC